MSLLRLLAIGAVGVVAWRAWQHRVARHPALPEDDGSRTAPHGDPVLAGARIDASPAPRPAAHSSRGFGDA
jgi:hypothetical protein